LQRIRDLVTRVQPDVVHAHGYKADIYVYLALRRLSVPLVSTCHTWYDNDPVVTLYGAADRLILRKYTNVVAVSEEVRQRLLKAGVLDQKIRLIRNGIDVTSYEEATPCLPSELNSPDSLIVGLVGRLSTEKGVDLFLRAAAIVLRKFPTAKFTVVGEGPDSASLKALIHELGIEANAFLLGRRENMPGIYASFDLMVSASRQEGLPMAILEGMASGLPLIATSVGQVPDVVVDGQSGVLVPPKDIDALAAAIISLLEDPSRRRLLGVAARKRIKENFSADRMAADYMSLYKNAASQIEAPHQAIGVR
jgi:glycosyltransferase involved in cell wall biosynthesis